MKLIFILFLIILTKNVTGKKKCLFWKEKLKVSCGFIYKNESDIKKTYAEVDWYYTNRKIFESFDNFCYFLDDQINIGCNLKNELFLLEKNHNYVIRYEEGKIIFDSGESDDYYESSQNFEKCFLCILNLYKYKK